MAIPLGDVSGEKEASESIDIDDSDFYYGRIRFS